MAGRHFGFLLTHETLISRYDRPHYFQDIMLRGMFKSFEHDHIFDLLPDGSTLMRDELRFAAPCGTFGWIAETLVLRRHLTGFLAERNQLIKKVAESTETWRSYIAES